jgi:hypothetical protein
MGRGKKATEEEFYKVQQLDGFGLSLKQIKEVTGRSTGFIKEMISYDSFEEYEQRNQAVQENLNFLDDIMTRPIGAYVDEHFKHEVITMLRDAFKFRPVAETEVMQFIEDHEHDTDLMQRINWQSFTKLPKYKEKHDV